MEETKDKVEQMKQKLEKMKQSRDQLERMQPQKVNNNNQVAKPNKPNKKRTIKNKGMFIGLLIVFILLASILAGFTYKIMDSNKKEVKVSGVLIDSNDYNDLILVEIEKQGTNEENKTVEQPQVNEEQKQEEKVKTQEKQKTEQKKQEAEKSNVASSNGKPYYIKVNYTANTVTIYGLDANGKYSVPIKAMVCSSGKDTPRSGVFKTPAKYRWALLNGNVWGQYSTRITKSILFHSVPYSKQSVSSLKANYYDKLGLAVSAGCIRLTVADAKWIYDNCPIGTMVEFYSSSDPGPLGKPTAMKISGYASYLNCWDPTDPDPNNPWIEYFKSQKNPQPEPQKQQEQQTQPEPQTPTQEEPEPQTPPPSQPETQPDSEPEPDTQPDSQLDPTNTIVENNTTTNTDTVNI